MDFIHGLLIMEDDLDDDDNDTPTSSAPQDTPVSGADPDPQTPDGSASPPWCKCSKCRVMPQDIENKCCGQRRCVTTHARFTTLMSFSWLSEIGVASGMTERTTAPGPSENLPTGNMSLMAMVILERGTGRCGLPV